MRHSALLLLGLMPALAMAQVYRWVDAQGVVHYSQEPPPKGSYNAVRPDPPPATPAPARDSAGAFLKQAEQQQADAAQRKAKDAETAAAAKQLCTRAREVLTELESGPPNRFYTKNPDGSTSRMPSEEWQRRRDAASAAVSQTCG